MHQPHDQWNFKTSQQERHEPNRAFIKFEPSDDAQTVGFGYSQTIYDLLKDPVALGMRGEGSNRGHQR